MSKPMPKVLVVEDEALLRAALSEFLLDDGFEVLGAANAAEAMDILSQHAHDIDLVFSDIKMPGRMDGIDLADWININQPSTPVVLTSGYSGKDALPENFAVGERFFPKPYSMERVAKKIRQLVVQAG